MGWGVGDGEGGGTRGEGGSEAGSRVVSGDRLAGWCMWGRGMGATASHCYGTLPSFPVEIPRT